MAASRRDKRSWARRVVTKLKRLYPDAHCALVHRSPLELLVATILSAQCTDARVNMVTPTLFRRYPTALSLAEADQGELESIIRSTGFFRNKAKNIRGACRLIVDKHGGKVPQTMAELLELPGVARKTANVVLGNAYGIPGMVVDTHVKRIARRLGLTRQTDPVRVEKDLMEVVPDKEWTDLSHRIIAHGRTICQARKPNCPECAFSQDCPKVGLAGPKKRLSGSKERRNLH